MKNDFTCQSPVQDDVFRKVNLDGDGNEFVTYEKVDYPKLQESLGAFSNWALNALLAAGIDPSFSIHTGNPTRIEGASAIDDFSQVADAIINEMNGEDN